MLSIVIPYYLIPKVLLVFMMMVTIVTIPPVLGSYDPPSDASLIYYQETINFTEPGYFANVLDLDDRIMSKSSKYDSLWF
jgi:hypothetical protein